ncbi:MAG: amino acid ABC transporter substrate-binding protein [Thermoprotei archaeon]|nr:MAG: amino acid ABC transporter substrate-binding protein [Thermoprotei archaeon]RLE89415.1 MAG: amino acid ABC transporter substrate-binding protein [Thermoprotei archaeon]
METKVIAAIVIALIIGVFIGYVINIPKIQQLEAELKELEKAAGIVPELKKQIENLKSENEELKSKLAKYTKSYVEEIKKRGKLIVGTSADWPPFEYIEDGNYMGIDIRIAQKIAEKLGVELEIKDMKFAALIEALKTGMVDMVIADMTPTAEREKVVDFSVPYYFSKGHAVLVLKESAIDSVEDLYGKKVGVQLGTTQEEWAKENLKGKAEIVSYNKVYPEMVMVLMRGDVSAILVGDIVGGVLTSKFPELKIAFYVGGSSVGAAVAVAEGAEDLKYVINSVIQELIETGEMDKIFEEEIAKWMIKE